MSTQGLYNSHPERERSPVKKLPAKLSTTTVCPGEHRRKVNQKMGLFTNLTLCLLGIFFLGAAKADTCAREWLQNQGNCYAYFDNKLSWQEAEIECQSFGRGAHLASVLTKAETSLVAEHISTYQQEPSSVWIGLHDVRQTRRWRWADESVYNYKLWMNHQPDNYLNNEHCVELVFSTGFTLWNDARCQKRNAYICKHEL